MKGEKEKLFFCLFFCVLNQAETNEALKSHEPGQCNVQMEAEVKI